MPPTNDAMDTTETSNDTVGTPAQKATDWEASYKGLQASFNKLQSASAKATGDLTAKVKGLEAQNESLDATILTHESAIKIKDSEISVLRKALDDEKLNSGKSLKALTRSRVILKEFSDLADYEAQDILPEAESEEDLRTKLANFRKVLGSVASQKKADQLQGASPKSPAASRNNGGEEETEDLIWQKITEFAGRDNAKYAEWLKKWDDIQLMKKQKAK